MRCNKFIFSLFFFSLTIAVRADNSIRVEAHEKTRYELYVESREHLWASLIPNQFVVQNAGNMGVLSIGTGWTYGREHWETQLLFGYIPKHDSSRGKLTMSVKENYIPWNIDLTRPHDGSSKMLKRGWSFSPLAASIYINTVFGHEFWKSQPGRYPDKYYDFMSTKFRLNIAFGQRITWDIPYQRRKYAKSITLFYEVGTCDLYIRSKFLDSSIPLKDILGLSLGIKFQTF